MTPAPLPAPLPGDVTVTDGYWNVKVPAAVPGEAVKPAVGVRPAIRLFQVPGPQLPDDYVATLAAERLPMPWSETPLPVGAAEPIPALERFVARTGISIVHDPIVEPDGGIMASWYPVWEQIHMIPISHFADPLDYYGVLFHEMGHSTLAETGRQQTAAWQPIAWEEAVAELTAIGLFNYLGLPARVWFCWRMAIFRRALGPEDSVLYLEPEKYAQQSFDCLARAFPSSN